MAGPLRGTLLDIGAGSGALTFELLSDGLDGAVAVDASEAYVAVGRAEAQRRGLEQAVEWKHGFVALASELHTAEVVTLDRVVCCYPKHEPLLVEAMRHAARWFALFYPNGFWYVRAVMALENACRRLSGNPFRTVMHSAEAMEQTILGGGFQLVSRRRTASWCADVYARTQACVEAVQSRNSEVVTHSPHAEGGRR